MSTKPLACATAAGALKAKAGLASTIMVKTTTAWSMYLCTGMYRYQRERSRSDMYIGKGS